MRVRPGGSSPIVPSVCQYFYLEEVNCITQWVLFCKLPCNANSVKIFLFWSTHDVLCAAWAVTTVWPQLTVFLVKEICTAKNIVSYNPLIYSFHFFPFPFISCSWVREVIYCNIPGWQSLLHSSSTVKSLLSIEGIKCSQNYSYEPGWITLQSEVFLCPWFKDAVLGKWEYENFPSDN